MVDERSPAESAPESRPVLSEISVVIPTLGRELLERSLEALAAADAWPAHVVVIDQGSSSEVAGFIGKFRRRGLNVEHVPSNQRGRASGVNRGIERVRTRFLAVTDDDCFVEADWLVRMLDKLRANPEAIVTGRVDPDGPEEVLAVMPSLTPAIYRKPRLKHDSMSGGNMGVAKEVIERVGLFDEDPRLSTAEDCELSYRALRAGVPIIYAPEIALRHWGWRPVRDRSDQYRGYARSIGGFFGKYLRRGDLFIALRVAIHHVRAFKRWLRGLLSADRDLAMNGRAYLFGTLPGILAGLRRRPGA